MIVLLFVMGVCFQSLYAWAAPLMDAIDVAFSRLGGWVASLLPSGPVQSLLSNGVIAGVGAVLVFLPQILILFFFIAVLEDCGYMARAAFLFDRWLRLAGLNGQSFIPLLSSFACAVPGIMACRTIEDRRDRLTTILVAPLMSCSARLPVYALMIGAFIPAKAVLGGVIGLQALTLLGMYSVGVAVAIPLAWLLKATLLKGPAQSFLLELPTYKRPSLRTVLYRMYAQGRAFCVTAGTLIFAVTIVIWAMGYYPRSAGIAEEHERARQAARSRHANGEMTDAALEEEVAAVDRAEAGALLRQSFLGRLGRFIEPAVRPLGWDWRIGTAVLASFPAREVVIATMGTIYDLGDEEDESSRGLREKLRAATWPDGRLVFTTPVALSIMVFFALCCQCGGTLAVIQRETRSWGWPIFTFAYMTLLAYLASWATYEAACRLT
jgi:ferrous iron transport protein B